MTAVKQVLRTDVWVDGVRYHAGTIPAASVAERITNPKAWADAPKPPEQAAEPVTPQSNPQAPAQGGPDGGNDGGDAFNPSDHTVADVQAYLETADEAERTRVLDAERSGKGRSTLIG